VAQFIDSKFLCQLFLLNPSFLVSGGQNLDFSSANFFAGFCSLTIPFRRSISKELFMALDTTTKQEWLDTFRGATLVLEPVFGNPKVNHMFSRNFDLIGRNAFFISVRGRILLGEDQVTLAEQHIYGRMDEIMKALERKIEAAKAIMLDAEITVMASYNKPTKHNATIISPMQTRYIQILQKADELLKYMSTLVLHGVIAEREHSKRELEIKHHMRVLPSAVRKVTIGLRTHLQSKTEGEKLKTGKVTTEAGSSVEAANDASDTSSIAVAGAEPAPEALTPVAVAA